MLKLLIINHSFQLEYYSRRWKLFAESHKDIDVTLLAPDEFEWQKNKAYSYGGTVVRKGKIVDEDNFHIRLFRMDFKRVWLSRDYKSIFLDVKPDIVYHIGDEMQISLLQVQKIIKRYLPNTKLILFSMMGPVSPLFLNLKFNGFHQWMERQIRFVYGNFVWRSIREHYSAIFCHYPDAIEYFKKIGYKGRLYMQTQVGVNTEWFHPDESARIQIREKYNISNSTYVFGSATRFSPDKGLDEIIEALPITGDWKFLMMGKGTEEQMSNIREHIKKRGLEDKIIITGLIDRFEIAKYWNAIDCAIHVPRTTYDWVETFSLSAVQPQAIKKPVIGNTSGSVPYQVGFNEMIVPEGDVKALNEKILWVLSHKDMAANIGVKMYERTIKSFSVQHLNDMFYDTIIDDIVNDTYDIQKKDMANYTRK